MSEQTPVSIQIDAARRDETYQHRIPEPLDFAMQRLKRIGTGRFQVSEGALISESPGGKLIQCTDGIFRPAEVVFLPTPDAAYLHEATKRYFDGSIDRTLEQAVSEYTPESLIRSARQLLTLTGANVDGLEVAQLVATYAESRCHTGDSDRIGSTIRALQDAIGFEEARKKAQEIIGAVIPIPVERINTIGDIEAALRRLNILFPVDRGRRVLDQHPFAQSLRNGLNTRKSQIITESKIDKNGGSRPDDKTGKKNNTVGEKKVSNGTNEVRVRETVTKYQTSGRQVRIRIREIQSEIDEGKKTADNPELNRLIKHLEHIEYMIGVNTDWLNENGF